MAQFELSQGTIDAISAALQSAGTNNANYIAAYNGNDIVAYNNANPQSPVNSATTYWFSQAGNVNGQAFNPTPAGTFIWNYTIAAAASEGYTINTTDLQHSSDNIASSVFTRLADNSYLFASFEF